jgi:hypothetical protein
VLQIEIDRQHQRVAGRRVDLVEHPQLAAEGVDLDVPAAVDAAQRIRRTPASSPDLPIRSPRRYWPERSRSSCVTSPTYPRTWARVAPSGRALGRDVDADSREVRLVRLDGDHLFPVEVALDDDFLEPRPAGGALEDGVGLGGALVEEMGQVLDRGLEVGASSGTRTASYEASLSTSTRPWRSTMRPRVAWMRRKRMRLFSESAAISSPCSTCNDHRRSMRRRKTSEAAASA